MLVERVVADSVAARAKVFLPHGCPQDGKSRRVWLNVTQEGKAAIDDLREGKLVNGLKLSTVDFQPVTAYQARGMMRATMQTSSALELIAFVCVDSACPFWCQVSLRGLKALEQVPDRLKAMVDSFVHTPVDHRNITPHELLHVRQAPPWSASQSGSYEADLSDGGFCCTVGAIQVPGGAAGAPAMDGQVSGRRHHSTCRGQADGDAQAATLGRASLPVGWSVRYDTYADEEEIEEDEDTEGFFVLMGEKSNYIRLVT